MLTALLTSAAALAAGPMPQVCAGVREPVIDVHIHSYDHDGRFDARVPNPRDGRPMTVFNGADHQELIVLLERRQSGRSSHGGAPWS